MNVRRHGNKYEAEVFECGACGCEFALSGRDVADLAESLMWGKEMHGLRCPECGEMVLATEFLNKVSPKC